MQLIKALFPASSYLTPASEAEFRRYLVQRTRNSTKRLALLCIGLMFIFSATDILLGDSWSSLNNLARYTAAVSISLYLIYSQIAGYRAGWR